MSCLFGTGPMSDYNSNALIAFREKLKTCVAMKPHLIDMLEKQAGGFMTRAEAQSVRNAEDPMGWLIEILLGKGDEEYSTFCDMLDKSNHCGWAKRLRQEPKPNRQKEGKKWRVMGRWRGRGKGRWRGRRALLTQTTETPYNARNT